jgi:cell cycle sensor histidine kinase DivJ
MTVQSRIGQGTTVIVTLPLTFAPGPTQSSSNIATLNTPLRAAVPDQAHQVKKRA